jgi:hypothetical protein
MPKKKSKLVKKFKSITFGFGNKSPQCPICGEPLSSHHIVARHKKEAKRETEETAFAA